MPPGVSDSSGTVPWRAMSPTRGSLTRTSVSRTQNCSSPKMSSMLHTGPHGTSPSGAEADDRLPVVARRPRARTIAFTSSRRSSRERLSRKRSSTASSGCPIARVRRSNHPVVGARDGHPPAVRARVVAVRRRGVGLGAAALAHVSGPVVDRRDLVEEPEDPVVQRDVDVLAAPGPLAGAQRQQHPEGAVQTGEIVGERRRPRDERRRVRLAPSRRRDPRRPARCARTPEAPTSARFARRRRRAASRAPD